MPEADSEEIIERFEAYATSLVPAMQAVAEGAGIHSERRSRVPGLAVENASPAERLVMALTGDNRAIKVSYGTEAGKFQQAGASTVICGPGHIAQAHKPNEFIDIAQIEACEAFMRRLMKRLQSPL